MQVKKINNNAYKKLIMYAYEICDKVELKKIKHFVVNKEKKQEILKIIIIITVFSILGYMKEIILIMFTLACVRPFTGGYHEYSHKRCLIATMTLAYFIILISKNSNLNNISTILLNIVNIFSIYHQSPIINTYMPITKENLIRRNKTIAVLNSIILSIISVIIIRYGIYSNIITWTLTMNVCLMFNLRESKEG